MQIELLKGCRSLALYERIAAGRQAFDVGADANARSFELFKSNLTNVLWVRESDYLLLYLLCVPVLELESMYLQICSQKRARPNRLASLTQLYRPAFAW